MEPSVYGLILLIVFILIGSACCSGVEAAFLAVNSIRILEIASKQKPKSSANQLLKLRKHLGRTLTVITITNAPYTPKIRLPIILNPLFVIVITVSVRPRCFLSFRS